MNETHTVSMIIPARNEAKSIASTIESVQALAHQLIVVDDGSEDDTGTIAARLGAEVLRRHDDPGKGQSLTCGTTSAWGDIIVFLDADLGDSAGEIRELIQVVTQGKAELAVARIPRAGAPGWGMVSKTSQRILTRMGVTVSQPLCGQRAMTRSALQTLLPLARGWGVEVAMLVKAARHRLVVVEVPTAIRHDGTGRHYRGTLHRARQGLDIASTLGRLALNSWK